MYFRTLKSILIRTFKPLLHPDVVYNIYKKLKGLEKMYELVFKLPLQVFI